MTCCDRCQCEEMMSQVWNENIVPFHILLWATCRHRPHEYRSSIILALCSRGISRVASFIVLMDINEIKMATSFGKILLEKCLKHSNSFRNDGIFKISFWWRVSYLPSHLTLTSRQWNLKNYLNIQKYRNLDVLCWKSSGECRLYKEKALVCQTDISIAQMKDVFCDS